MARYVRSIDDGLVHIVEDDAGSVFTTLCGAIKPASFIDEGPHHTLALARGPLCPHCYARSNQGD